MFEAMGKYNEELVKAGIMLSGDGLKPSKFGKRIHFSGARRSVTDGPFAETKELVAGYWVWQVRSMEEAVPRISGRRSPRGRTRCASRAGGDGRPGGHEWPMRTGGRRAN
jgi:hypothetical protein